MEVQFTCECGQVLQADVGTAGQTVRCPACGRMLAVSAGSEASAPPAAAPPTGKPTSAKATAALIFGLCSFLPGIGLLCAPIAIGLGIAVLVKKLNGKGFGITGVVTGAAGLLIVQTIAALMVYGMFMFVQTTTRMMTAMAPTVPPPGPPVAQLDDEEIGKALSAEGILPSGPTSRPADLTQARRDYVRRGAEPGALFLCVRTLRRHLLAKGAERFEDAKDQAMLEAAQEELVSTVREAYGRACGLEDAANWADAHKAFEGVIELIPDAEHAIQKNAAAHRDRCKSMAAWEGAGQPTPDVLVEEAPNAPQPPAPRPPRPPRRPTDR